MNRQDRTRDEIPGDVWCLTCEWTHIDRIPVVTFACADCGYGGWILSVAATHATEYPSHAVYANVHRVVPLEEKPCP